VKAGAAPRYGTCVIDRPAICRNIISARYGALPVPGDAIVNLPGCDLTKSMNSLSE
jgi:hypothetical protein